MRSKDAQSRGNLDSLRENSVLATIIRPDSREFYHRKLSSLHPYERDFSIFKQRPVPTIPPFLVQFVRRDMEQVLSRISRLVTDADYADSSYSSTTSFRARSHSTTRSYDIDGSTLANGKNGHRKPFTEMDHRRVVIEELAGLRESRSTSSRPQIFDAFVSNNFDNGAHKRGRQIIEVDDDEEEEDVQVLVQPPTTAPPPPPPPRQNMRHKGLDTVWKEIPSTHQIERWWAAVHQISQSFNFRCCFTRSKWTSMREQNSFIPTIGSKTKLRSRRVLEKESIGDFRWPLLSDTLSAITNGRRLAMIRWLHGWRRVLNYLLKSACLVAYKHVRSPFFTRNKRIDTSWTFPRAKIRHLVTGLCCCRLRGEVNSVLGTYRNMNSSKEALWNEEAYCGSSRFDWSPIHSHRLEGTHCWKSDVYNMIVHTMTMYI